MQIYAALGILHAVQAAPGDLLTMDIDPLDHNLRKLKSAAYRFFYDGRLYPLSIQGLSFDLQQSRLSTSSNEAAQDRDATSIDSRNVTSRLVTQEIWNSELWIEGTKLKFKQ